RLLSPAAAYDEAAPRRAWASSSGEERDKALARGTLVHRLLQSLPDIPKAARADTARRYLARSAATFSAEERETIVAQLGRLLEDPRFSELFAPGSRARSEEHTSELQSRFDLVCRLLLEKKNASG